MTSLLSWFLLFAMHASMFPQTIPDGTGAVGGTTICGNSNADNNGSIGSGNHNFAIGANSCVPSQSESVLDVGVTWFASSGNLSAAVYLDSGGLPTGSPLCTVGSTAATSGNQEVPITGCGTLSSGSTYWVILNADNNTAAIGKSTAGAGTKYAYQASTFPNFPTGGTWTPTSTPHACLYLRVSP